MSYYCKGCGRRVTDSGVYYCCSRCQFYDLGYDYEKEVVDDES